MYKILALNCLITAYSLSVQYLDGIKFGDYQITITSMLMSVCFLCISRAKVSHVMPVLHMVLLTFLYCVARGKTFPRTAPRQHIQLLRAALGPHSVCHAHCLLTLYHALVAPIRGVSASIP